ncbi:hypothetical protein [Streptomyces hydrogenans]|uniref:hypothetical protein n=1 Tax=Streptomyces hydrogenans TaxID=1873719 RepID=UPI003D743DD1
MTDVPTLPARVADTFALILRGLRTRRCPVPGCGVVIRFRAVSKAEEKRLTARAHDHAGHGSRG